MKVAGIWRYVYRAVDECGQVIDIYVSTKRDIAAARKFFAAMLNASDEPEQIITDRAAALANVIEELLPGSFHNTEKYANNRVECDHGRLKARLRPMRGIKTIRTANVVIRGHAFIQNLRRNHYELGVDARNHHLRTRRQDLTEREAGSVHTRFAITQRNSAGSTLLRIDRSDR